MIQEPPELAAALARYRQTYGQLLPAADFDRWAAQLAAAWPEWSEQERRAWLAEVERLAKH